MSKASLLPIAASDPGERAASHFIFAPPSIMIEFSPEGRIKI